MRRSLPFVLFLLVAAAALPAQAQLLKKLEETLKKAVPPATKAAAPAAAPKPASSPEDGDLPVPPAAGRPLPGFLGVEGDTESVGGVEILGFNEAGKAKAS